jgi:hypothetical protein
MQDYHQLEAIIFTHHENTIYVVVDINVNCLNWIIPTNLSYINIDVLFFVSRIRINNSCGADFFVHLA